MERSSHYDKSIGEVRKLRSEGVEAAEVKERAKLLRMELMLDNAQAAREIISHLTENPDATAEQLQNFIQNKHLVIHPKVAENFINNLVTTKEQVRNILPILKIDAEKDGTSIERRLYSFLLRVDNDYDPDSPPKGNLELDASYPLALSLFVEEPDDFERIDERKNVGGFYAATKNYNHLLNSIEEATGNGFVQTMQSGHTFERYSFPLIALKGTGDPTQTDDIGEMQSRAEGNLHSQQIIADHEKGHAENRIFADTMQQTRRKMVWGRIENINSVIDATQILIGSYAKDINTLEETRDSDAWRSILSYALTHAKDELLAEALAKKGEVKWHIGNLKKRDGLYNYFKDYLGIDPDSATGDNGATARIYDELWSDYEAVLDKATETVLRIVAAYREYGLSERIQLFRWVLSQIPLERWSEQLEGTLFTREANELLSFVHAMYEENRDPLEMRQPGVTEWKEFEEFRSQCKSHQTKPLISLIESYKAKELHKRQQVEEGLKEECKNLRHARKIGVLEAGRRTYNWEYKQLIQHYNDMCDFVGIKPDEEYIIDFLYQDGWVPEDHYLKFLERKYQS